ncbi:hypothetical protein PIB30_100546, partial [Stylosanthes scabra]|nr:hypothetical protein [Stylosanthes scabra]
RLGRMGTHMRRTKRICVEGRGYAEVSGWIWLVSGTHMRGGYAYAWVTEPGFNRLRLSYLVLPLLICSEPSHTCRKTIFTLVSHLMHTFCPSFTNA